MTKPTSTVLSVRKKLGLTSDQYTTEIIRRKLEVNGEKVTMTDFLYTNLCEPDVEHIVAGDAKDILALNVGETKYIGHSTITRIK